MEKALTAQETFNQLKIWMKRLAVVDLLVSSNSGDCALRHAWIEKLSPTEGVEFATQSARCTINFAHRCVSRTLSEMSLKDQLSDEDAEIAARALSTMEFTFEDGSSCLLYETRLDPLS